MKANLIQDSRGTTLSEWQHSSRLANAPGITVDELCPPGQRLVLVAPHPDDEILMAGGLLSAFRGREHELLIVSVTDGECSHPHSSDWTEQRLREQRPQESREALQRLGLNVEAIEWLRLGLRDTDVAKDEHHLVNNLCQLLDNNDALMTTWQVDGHGDHEAVGRACAQAALASNIQLLEVPVWAWHWATPEDERLPWRRARRLALDEDTLARKRQAIAAHASQVTEDGGRAPVLSAATLECLLQPFELVFV